MAGPAHARRHVDAGADRRCRRHPARGDCWGAAPTFDLAALERLEPEVVVVKRCSYPIERTLAELELFPRLLPWVSWPQCRPARCTWSTATPTSTASGLGSSTRPSSWPPACTAAVPGYLARYREAVQRVNANLQVHDWGIGNLLLPR